MTPQRNFDHRPNALHTRDTADKQIPCRSTTCSMNLEFPWSSLTPFGGGLFLLFISALNLPSDSQSSKFVRLALAPPTVFLFLQFAYGPYETSSRLIACGMPSVGLYLAYKASECALAGLIRGIPLPRWINQKGIRLLAPESSLVGITFALDYLTTVRGVSWLTSTSWCFLPSILAAQVAPTRKDFVRSQFNLLLATYVLMDVFDTLNKLYSWDTTSMNPVSSLPSVLLQILYSCSVCAGVALQFLSIHTLASLVSVSLGSPPSAWPPMFNSPLSSASLADFWAKRWHLNFRRPFSTLTTLLLTPLPKTMSRQTERTLRIVSAFVLSAFWHAAIVWRLPTDDLHPHPRFLDSSTFAFFLSQPVGIVVEHHLVQPLAECFTPQIRQLIMRVWTWAFLCWTGRWWADVWVRRGLWDQNEDIIPLSLVRGLLWGKWTIH